MCYLLGINTGCIPTKLPSESEPTMVAAKLFALKFGHQAVKTLVGCYGRSMDFIAFKLGAFNGDVLCCEYMASLDCLACNQ